MFLVHPKQFLQQKSPEFTAAASLPHPIRALIGAPGHVLCDVALSLHDGRPAAGLFEGGPFDWRLGWDRDGMSQRELWVETMG